MLEYWPLTMSRLNLRSVIIFVASSSEASGKMLRGLPMSWHTFQTWSGLGSGLGLGLLWETFGVRVVSGGVLKERMQPTFVARILSRLSSLVWSLASVGTVQMAR